MWRVVRDFADAQDKGYVYHAGDNFPRSGTATEARLAELAGRNNLRGVPLIEEYTPEESPRRGKRKTENEE